MKRVVSPLRYPGSKARIVELIAALLEQNLLVGSHLYEPFAGGAAVSLGLLANSFVPKATWIERDPMIFAFWSVVQTHPNVLIDRMLNSPVTLAAWKSLLPTRAVEKPTRRNMLDLAYAGLFYNRTCFSGIIGAGPIGGMGQNSAYKIDCRFNKKELAIAIRSCSELLKTVDLIFGDGIEYLQKNALKFPSHAVVYIDPPYVQNGHKLYRRSFNRSDHERLADAVGDLRAPWLLSYDNHELVRNLYVGGQAKYVKTYQSLKGARFMKEILLLSDDFRLPSSQQAMPMTSRRARGRAEISDVEM